MTDFADMFAGMTSDFGNKLLGSVRYPFIMNLDSRAISGTQDDEVTHAYPWEPDKSSDTLTKSDVDVADYGENLGELFAKLTLAILAEGRNGKRDDSGDEYMQFAGETLRGITAVLPDGTEKPLLELTPDEAMQFYAKDPDTEKALRGLWDKIKKAFKEAWPTIWDAAKSWVKRHLKIETKDAQLKIRSQPEAVVGSPVELRNLDFDVRIKFRGCVKFLGKWYCSDWVQIPWIHLTAAAVYYDLTTSGVKVLGRPRVSNLDIVVTLKFFGKTYEIKIGITGIVNGDLKDSPPDEIFDASTLAVEIASFKKRFYPQTVHVFDGEDYFNIGIEGEFQPL